MPALPTYTFGTNLTALSSPVRVDGDLICLPGRWTSVLRFFLLNYVAHAFTIWARPGEKTFERLFAMFLAIIFPVAGLGRGMEAIRRCASFHKHGGLWKGLFGLGTNEYEIHKAGRAGALGIVVREPRFSEQDNSWFSFNHKGWERTTLRGERVTVVSTANNVHRLEMESDPKRLYSPADLRWSCEIDGLTTSFHCEYGYRIIQLPSTLVKSVKIPGDDLSTLRISQNSNALVSLVAVVQIVYGAYLLARVTGDQFERFGYSAFHLTVLPYMVMSFINLIGNLVTPIYSSIYLVGTSVSEEAQRRGYDFGNCIGFLDDCYLSTQMDFDNVAEKLQDFRVVPWSCQRGKAAEYEDQNVHTAASSSRYQPTDAAELLNTCFERECNHEHQGVLNISSGVPREQAPRSSSHSFLQSIPLIAVWVVALGAHIAPIVYCRIKYGQPRSLDRKIIFPLWIAFGDLFGLYLLFTRTSFSVFSFLLAWFWAPRRLRFAFILPAAKAFIIIFGLAVGIWNFYLVAVQILDFGSCIHISD